MLKTYNVTDKYDYILDYLASKKNQSGFICELVAREMQQEESRVQMDEVSDRIRKTLIDVFYFEGRRMIQEIVETELKRALDQHVYSTPQQGVSVQGKGVYYENDRSKQKAIMQLKSANLK